MREGIPEFNPNEAVGHVARHIAGLTRRLEDTYVPLAELSDVDSDEISWCLADAREALATVQAIVRAS